MQLQVIWYNIWVCKCLYDYWVCQILPGSSVDENVGNPWQSLFFVVRRCLKLSTSFLVGQQCCSGSQYCFVENPYDVLKTNNKRYVKYKTIMVCYLDSLNFVWLCPKRIIKDKVNRLTNISYYNGNFDILKYVTL